MKRILSLMPGLTLLVVFALPAFAAEEVPETVLKQMDSVVRILAEYRDGYVTGSGFVIKSDKEETLIATNYHVVEDDPYNISVWVSSDEKVSASVLVYSDQKDLCILKLSTPIDAKALLLAEAGAKQGEAVYAVGYPGAADDLSDTDAHASSDATITDGIVSALREATVSEYGSPIKILQINAAINHGNSGGPLFNKTGQVVGINTYGIADAQGIFGAIDVQELRAFLDSCGIVLPETEAEIAFLWGTLIVVAVAVVVLSTSAIVLWLWIKRKKNWRTTDIGRSHKTRQPMQNNRGITTSEVSAVNMNMKPKMASTSGEISGCSKATDMETLNEFAGQIVRVKAVIRSKPALSEEPEATEIKAVMESGTEKQRIKRKFFVVIGACTIAALVFLCSYFGLYFQAGLHANADCFSRANSCLFLKPLTRLHDPKLCAYIDAGLNLEARKYEAAKEGFSALSDYRNAEEMVLEADYRYASQMADANQFEEAIVRYRALSEKGYKDSYEKIWETHFRRASYFLYEVHDYEQAKLLFQTLIGIKYQGADEMLKETIYLWAIDHYEKGEFVEAHDKFCSIRGYLDVDEIVSELTELMYSKGLSQIEQNEYIKAASLFVRIVGYKDSEQLLLYAHEMYVKKSYGSEFAEQVFSLAVSGWLEYKNSK